jgi:dipeptide/tripeptide permease
LIHHLFSNFSAILALYLNRKLNFDPSTSTAIFHTNELLAYSFTIIGAIIADSWLGLFNTILWMSLVFAVGSTVVALAAIESLSLPTL